MKNIIFARFARAFFIFWHFVDVLVLSTTWNDLFCSCVDDVSIWWQMFNFVFLSCPKRWFQFNSRIVRTHFSSIMTLNNWKMIAVTSSHTFQMTFSLSSTSCLLRLPNCTCCSARDKFSTCILHITCHWHLLLAKSHGSHAGANSPNKAIHRLNNRRLYVWCHVSFLLKSTSCLLIVRE